MVKQDSRSMLLGDIKGGIKLKKVDKNENERPKLKDNNVSNESSYNIYAKLDEFRKLITQQSDDDSSSDSGGWDD